MQETICFYPTAPAVCVCACVVCTSAQQKNQKSNRHQGSPMDRSSAVLLVLLLDVSPRVKVALEHCDVAPLHSTVHVYPSQSHHRKSRDPSLHEAPFIYLASASVFFYYPRVVPTAALWNSRFERSGWPSVPLSPGARPRLVLSVLYEYA